MIKTVRQYLDAAGYRVGMSDRIDIERMLDGSGVDPLSLSDPRTEFACDAAIWATMHRSRAAKAADAGDPNGFLDELAGDIVDAVAMNWWRRSLLCCPANSDIDPPLYLKQTGIKSADVKAVTKAVRSFLTRQAKS